ncbi:AAA family ATPase [Facklamia sp. 7083-14-GEN3]|uniref:AAA family ATPase n=1 Tax=Facklamia sp. 7083-14-GEN3 TaxID=2973478 RepID=UPI00215CAFD3|nr:AAA family ATPase [Facklamia sp. 7083-14-GEN3]MCR8968440.1 AAA family ATPase [Facklamia sp. 7083-14-GEN3]
MPKLIVIRGNSASGKTTLAKRLQKAFGPNTLVLSQDIVRRNMLYVRDEVDTEAIKLLTTLVEYGFANNKITILEGILNSEWYQALFEKALELYGQKNIHAYYYDLSFEETLSRHLTRNERLEFGEAELKRWWNRKDYIGFIKEEIFTEEIGIEEAVERIVLEVKSD